jgi:hypothetical protein
VNHFWLLLSASVLLCFGRIEGAWEITGRETLPAPEGIDFQRVTLAAGSQKAEIHLVSFRTAKHRLAVLDDADGGGTMATAASEAGAVAAVNGGYFHPDRRPLGLVMSGSEKVHAYEKARLLSGLVLAGKDQLSIVRAAQYKPAKWMTDALQAGPFLIDGGKPVTGLNDKRPAARTVVLTPKGAGRAALVVCKWVTLAEMAQILALPDLIPGGAVMKALNLDGGSSTGMWVRQDSDVFHMREGRDVRNYLAVIPK